MLKLRASARPTGFILLCALCFAVISLINTVNGASAEPSPWLLGSPTLSKLEDLPPGELPPYSINGNRDCINREVVTRPKRIVPIPQAKVSYTGCAVDTNYGSVDTSGNLQRAGTTIAGQVTKVTGATANLIPIPRTNTSLQITGNTYNAAYVAFTKNFDAALDSSSIYTGEVTHKITKPFDKILTDRSGAAIPVVYDSISFSPDGGWMIADVPYIGTIRVNTETYEVLPFGPLFNYNSGQTPGLQTAITSDGRYAALASNSGTFLLFDLNTCSSVPNHITTKVSCNYTDLSPLMKQQASGFKSVSRLRFKGNYELEFYAGYLSGTTTKISHYTLLASGQEASGFEYLALGDSFASGEGAYQYKALTDTSNNKCHLSQRSYPYLIGTSLGLNQYESVACSGALINDLGTNNKDYTGQVHDHIERQFRDSNGILSGFSPGFIAQHEFTDNYQPRVITLSAGGNDIGFADKIQRCLDSDTCYNTYEDRLEIINEINSKFYDLVSLYNQLKESSDPNTKIYIIGYPQIGDPNGNCADNVHLNHDELVFAQRLISYFNSVIKTAANNAGVYYVDVEDAFTGHKLCETKSWDVAVNGLTAGNDLVDLLFLHGPIGNESYHPNALGHTLLEQSILKQTDNFTASMPKASDGYRPSEPDDTMPLLAGMPRTNRTIQLIRQKTGTNGGIIQTGKSWFSNFTGLGQTLKVSSKIRAWLHSNPYDLGVFTPDSNGDINLSLTLPDSFPAGFHTLELAGQNTAGEYVSYYQTVYVADPNATNSCVVVPDSGHDVDQDHIDDACDGFIDKAPGAKPTVANTDPLINANNQVVVADVTGTSPIGTTSSTTDQTSRSATQSQGLASTLSDVTTVSPRPLLGALADETSPIIKSKRGFYAILAIVICTPLTTLAIVISRRKN